MVRLPEYFKPDYEKISYPADYGGVGVKKIMEEGERLANNMWLVGRIKRYGNRGYQTRVLIKNGRDYYTADFPTNAKGEIPETAMVERLMDLADGDRKNKQRNIFIDVAITAKDTNNRSNLSKSYLWYLYPNEGDIKGIDDVNTKIVTILPKSTKDNRRSLIIMGGTQEQRNRVAKIIEDNFTLKEKRVLAGVLFNIGGLSGRAAGTYQRARIIGQGGGISIISLDPKYLNEMMAADVTIHEAIHALRDKDTNRLPDLKRRATYIVGRDSDLEESLTEAETNTRERPYNMPDASSIGMGYYPRIKDKGDKTIKDLVIDDRISITEPKDKSKYAESGKRGKTAQRLLVKNYPETHISKLKLAGNVEAIDTYWRTKDRGGVVTNTQIFAPKAKINPTGPRGELETVRFDDGRAITISKKRVKLSPKIPRLK